jgi:hypothetical protein
MVDGVGAAAELGVQEWQRHNNSISSMRQVQQANNEQMIA